MVSRVTLFATLAVSGLGSLNSAAYAQYYGRGCADGACGQPPSQIVESSSVVPNTRVVYHDRVIPRTQVVDHNRVVLHRHTLHHQNLTVHKHRVRYHTTVLHRHNTVHRRAVVPQYDYAQQHLYYAVQTVEHRHIAGHNRWCNCAGAHSYED